MVDFIVEMLGAYVPLNGEGLASINFPWVIGALSFLLVLWFVFRLILKLIGGGK